MAEIEDAITKGWAVARREDPQPTVAYFRALLTSHPDSPQALFAYASALDYAGCEGEAALAYEQAFAAGLEGDQLRRGLLQYGSTLRNLGRVHDAVAALRKADDLFPGDAAVKVFLALALTSAKREREAVANLIVLALDRIPGEELQRYDWALRQYAEALGK
ncbi:tetratricopeptide repeat protein [Streptomyces sp. NPDC048643]|uniref:tetratricopeptide repeat protein n=1 Tax=Streptomyces sp. NPDC048643 TaxID=3155637 RepID=UPI003442AD74